MRLATSLWSQTAAVTVVVVVMVVVVVIVVLVGFVSLVVVVVVVSLPFKCGCGQIACSKGRNVRDGKLRTSPGMVVDGLDSKASCPRHIVRQHVYAGHIHEKSQLTLKLLPSQHDALREEAPTS
eukprot:4634045-Amphidinium_carterae.3